MFADSAGRHYVQLENKDGIGLAYAFVEHPETKNLHTRGAHAE